MANLPETSQWEAGIYQIETTDPVVGGRDGISNLQAKLLANRTAYLKAQIEALGSELAALGITDISGLQAALDGKVPWGAADAVITAAGLTPDHNNLGQMLSALQTMGLQDATKTRKGVVELATSAEVQAGVDDMRAVTPAGLLAGLLGSGGTGSSDYIVIPFRHKSTGARLNLIVQWVLRSAGETSGTWPIAFPTACLVAMPGAVIENKNDYTLLNVTSITTTGFTSQVYGGPVGSAPTTRSYDYYVVAIGH